MEFGGCPFKPSTTTNTPEKLEAAAGPLLEESWFFGNLLDTKTRTMSRCYSDTASGSCSQEILVDRSSEERKSSSFSSKKKLPVAAPRLMKTPSLPISLSREAETREGHSIPSLLVEKANQCPSLMLAPSVPTSAFEDDQTDCIEDEEDDDQESEFTMGRLIRQASLNSSHMWTPPRQTDKSMTQSSSFPRCPLKKPEVDEEKINNMRVLEVNKERKRSETPLNNSKGKNKGGAPKIPGGWVDKSSAEDMKAQIRFWARAVASNVRQEC